jgi:hypothetical protein
MRRTGLAVVMAGSYVVRDLAATAMCVWLPPAC